MRAQERITQLNSEIADIEDFLAYWCGNPEFDQVEEAPARIAVLETDLENLRSELKVLMESLTLSS